MTAAGQLQWSVTAAAGTMTCSSGIVYVLGSDGYLRAYDASNGGLNLWTYPATGSGLSMPTSAPAVYHGSVYVLDKTGRLQSILAGRTQGTAGPVVSMPEGLDQTQPLFFEDGIVYGSNDPSGGNLLMFAVEIATGTPISYATGQVGRFLGVENGTCLFTHADGSAVAGVSLSTQLHGFFAESELMADDYPGGSVKAQGTSYRVHVRLQDPNNNPRVNKSVKIWVSNPPTPVQITVGNQSATVSGQDTALWATTDGVGELSIVVTATDLTCPAIYLWGTFMYQEEAMLVYPDHQTVNQLSNVTGEGLSSGTDYGSQNVLQPNSGNAESIATHIRNTLTGSGSSIESMRRQLSVGQALRRGRHRTRPNLQGADSYTAYPGACPNLVYQAQYDPSLAPNRAFKPANAVAGTLTLGSSSAIFQPGLTTPMQLEGVQISLGGILSDIVHGAEEVFQVVVTVAETVVHQIKTVTGKIYKLVIDSVEAAVTSVAAVLKTIAKNIQSVVEWLSYLFDWGSIVTNAVTISNAITSRFDGFKTWLSSEAGSVDKYISHVFGNLETDVTNAFNSAVSAIGGNSLQSQQQGGNNPQGIYSHTDSSGNTTSSYTKSQWLTMKVKSNIGSAQDAISQSRKGITVADDPFLSAGEAFITTLKNKLAQSDYAALPADFEKLVTSFGVLFKDPEAFVSNSFTAILDLIRDVAVLLLEFTGDLLTSFIDALAALIDGALSVVTATISIPVIGELWAVVTKNELPLSILNVVALVISVPATIISKAAGSSVTQRASVASGSAADTLLSYAQIFAGAIYAIFDGLVDLLDINAIAGKSKVLIALSVSVLGLGFPQPLPADTPISFVWYALSAFPIVYAGYVTYANTTKSGSYELINAQNGSTNGLFGVIMLSGSVLGYMLDKPDFDDPNHLTLVQNIFTYLPYFGKAFAAGPAVSPARIAVSVIDAVGDLTSTGIGAFKAFA